MYQIFADNTLIYDSTIDDYKIGRGEITKEVDKSGSFVFSLYPDHPFYDRFVKLKTVVLVRKSGKVAFRGRVLNDVTDYWNKGDFTCEGELGFLQDSIARPFEFTGTPADLFKKFIEDHNAQVDEFKRFKIGTVTVADGNNQINRSTGEYSTTRDIITAALTGTDLGGHIYVTHGDDGTDEMPTIHYVEDFPKTATQDIEFGVNLKDYTKTVKAEDVATAVIPLGTQTGTDGQRLTIVDVNGGVDYLYNAEAVAARGWVFKTVVWDDVTLAQNLKTKGQAWLDHAIKQAVTIELTAVDLHLLDRGIESYNVCEYVRARSKPHGFDEVMLCNRQTMDLLQPGNDTVTLGYQTTTFTGSSTQLATNVSTLGKKVSSIKQSGDQVAIKVENLSTGMIHTLRVAEDGVTITDAEGKTVLISGGQLAANSVKADAIDATDLKVYGANILELYADLLTAGVLKSKDGETFKLDLDAGTFTMKGSGKFQSTNGHTYVQVDGNELVLYALEDATKKFTDKIRLGFIPGPDPANEGVEIDYPYMLLGNSGGTVGMIKKFYNGLWVGNSVPRDLSGNFEGMAGASGFFINTETGNSYVVKGTEMQNVYTGAAIAKFA